MLLSVRLTPRAASDRVDRIAPVRAVPEKGLANEALIRLLADTLGVPKSALSLSFGSKGREKRVRVEGDGASLENALRAHACFRPSGDA